MMNKLKMLRKGGAINYYLVLLNTKKLLKLLTLSSNICSFYICYVICCCKIKILICYLRGSMHNSKNFVCYLYLTLF